MGSSKLYRLKVDASKRRRFVI